MAGKKKPRLLNRFKLILLNKGGFSHAWISDRLVVGFQGYQFTFFMEESNVTVLVFGSRVRFCFPVESEFDLFARCESHGLFNVVWLKNMYDYSSNDIQKTFRKVG